MTKTFLKPVLLSAIALFVASGTVGAADFLADRHAARGIACTACHGDQAPAPGAKVAMAQCLACHESIDKVAERSKARNVDPNPHYNHLVGLNCLECHRGHQEGAYLCSGCHNLKTRVP